jgi:hypothetical protein
MPMAAQVDGLVTTRAALVSQVTVWWSLSLARQPKKRKRSCGHVRSRAPSSQVRVNVV